MRILIANHHCAVAGGIETHLRAVIAKLSETGHEILFIHEAPATTGDELIPLPADSARITLTSDTMERIREWKPDIAYVHALHNLDFQSELIEAFPTVAFAHGYYGLCISGSKTWKRSPARPCAKNFDWKCLLHFHAKQCGGSSPITMLQDFRRQSRQLDLLRQCDAVIAHDGQMSREYETHGIKVRTLPHFVEPPTLSPTPEHFPSVPKIIYIGRFDVLKGGQIFLEALPLLKMPLRVRLVGSGPADADWKRRAAQISRPDLQIEFTGWLSREKKDALLADSDLIVVPSLWPEPFGQVGLEANQLGVPAVAFASGGISNWLREGVNGHLASADPPSPRNLAEAIRKSLGNAEHYAKLRAGAIQVASNFSVEKHISALMAVFEEVLQQRR